MSQVGLGLVGLGRWSRAHAEAAARSRQVRFVSCYSRTESKRAEFASAFEIDRTASSFADLLADPDVEGVVIATPNDVHVQMALEAIAAGVPALVDKPISVDLEGGLDLLRAAPDGDQLGIAHHARRLAVMRETRRWIDSTRADVRFATANFSNPRGAKLDPDAWYTRVRGSEAGVLIQVGIHPVENMLWLFGPAVSVNARFTTDAGESMPKGAIVIIGHASGVVSTVTTSWTTPGLFAVEVQAAQGNLRCRADHRVWKEPEVDAHSSLWLDTNETHDTPVELVPGDPLVQQLDELGAAARGTGRMEVDSAAGIRAMGVVLAAVDSAASAGAEVRIAPMLARAGASDDEIAHLVESR